LEPPQPADADGGGDDTCDAGLAVVEGQDKEGHRRDCIRVMKAAGMTVRGLTPAGWPLVELRSYGRVSCDAAMETLATVTAEADEAPKWLVFSSVSVQRPFSPRYRLKRAARPGHGRWATNMHRAMLLWGETCGPPC
jgi:hypothetical protein